MKKTAEEVINHFNFHWKLLSNELLKTHFKQVMITYACFAPSVFFLSLYLPYYFVLFIIAVLKCHVKKITLIKEKGQWFIRFKQVIIPNI